MMGEKMDELKNVELLQEFNELIGYKRSIKDFMGLFLAADLAATKAIKEHKLYKKLGYTWSTFCTERLKMGRKAVDTYLRSKLLQQDTAGAMVSARKLITESLSYFELCCSVHYLKLGKQGYYAPEYMPDFENF